MENMYFRFSWLDKQARSSNTPENCNSQIYILARVSVQCARASTDFVYLANISKMYNAVYNPSHIQAIHTSAKCNIHYVHSEMHKS